jgi:Cu2+-exporting ATPase
MEVADVDVDMESTDASGGEDRTTHLFFARNGRVLTTLYLEDQMREGVADVMAALAPARCAIISGDGTAAVEGVAKACGISEWMAYRNPMEKREWVRALRERGEVVAMVGDGVNDAPALTQAHIGVSVATATDMSVQVSDILLTTDRLDVLPKIRKLARKGERVIRQNLFWAFFYNGVGVTLAAFGVLTPLFAAVAMVLSSLMVIFNALRLRG